VNPEMKSIVDKLLVKARSGKVNWIAAAELGLGSKHNDFVVSFPNFAVNVYQGEGTAAIGVAVLNDRGQSILHTAADPGQDGYGELSELLDLANRQHLRVDETLRSLREALEAEGTIGLTRPTFDDDDLPF
jgi:hypothetical protein